VWYTVQIASWHYWCSYGSCPPSIPCEVIYFQYLKSGRNFWDVRRYQKLGEYFLGIPFTRQCIVLLRQLTCGPASELLPHFQFLDLIHSKWDTLYGGSACHKASTYIGQHKHWINAHNTDIHAFSGIRTHDPSIRASEDSSFLRLCSHCDEPR
jgi:hypothetical protein